MTHEIKSKCRLLSQVIYTYLETCRERLVEQHAVCSVCLFASVVFSGLLWKFVARHLLYFKLTQFVVTQKDVFIFNVHSRNLRHPLWHECVLHLSTTADFINVRCVNDTDFTSTESYWSYQMSILWRLLSHVPYLRDGIINIACHIMLKTEIALMVGSSHWHVHALSADGMGPGKGWLQARMQRAFFVSALYLVSVTLHRSSMNRLGAPYINRSLNRSQWTKILNL